MFAGAREAVGCLPIGDFVKDVENGRSQKLGAHFKLIDTKKDGSVTVRRFSHISPSLQPSEIMEVEIIDDDDPWSRAWEQKWGRRLRIRPHSVSHWIEVMASAVWIDIVDTDQGCPHEGCHRFSIIFAGKGGALLVGFGSRWLGERKWQIERVSLSVRGYYSPTCE
jgi:hypothetical protein